MVKLHSVFALFALAAVVPAQESGESEVKGFWEKWVEDIEANPETAASPEDAWAGFNATVTESQSS